MNRLLLILFFISFQISYAQWQKCDNGLYGGSVLNIVTSGNYVFAGTKYGVFVSSDKGNNWKEKSNGLNDIYIRELITVGNYVLAQTKEGIFITTDNGDNWLPRNEGLYLNNLYYVTSNGTIIYAATDAGLFQSVDYGKTWIPKGAGLYYFTSINCMAASGPYFFVSSDEGLFCSKNGGTSWQKTNMKEKVSKLLIKGNRVFAADIKNGLVVSDDFGYTWNECGTFSRYRNVDFLAAVDDNIYAEILGIMYKSSDNGISWNKYFSLSTIQVNAFALNGNEIYAGIDSLAIMYSSDNGASWNVRTNGFNNTFMHNIGADKDGYIYVVNSNKGIFVSSDKGQSWQPAKNNMEHNDIQILTTRGNNIFLGTGSGLFLSTNHGDTWILKDALMTYYGLKNLLIKDSMFYACTDSGLFVSDSSLSNWKGKNKGVISRSVLSIDFGDSFQVAGSRYGYVYFSKNNGENWILRNKWMNSVNINSVKIRNGQIYLGTVGGVYYSGDTCGSWTSIGLTSEYVTYLSFFNEYIMVGGDLGVYITSDNGNSWKPMNDGLKCKDVNSIVLLGDYFYAATNGKGIFRAKTSDFFYTDVKYEDLSNNEISIYPNPVQNILKIRLNKEIAAVSNVQVFDMLGRKVLDSVIGEGNNDYEIDLEGLQSGIYLLKLNNKITKIVKI